MTKDPVTRDTLGLDEMVDQVAIFFWRGMKPAHLLWLVRFIFWRKTLLAE
jgi:hypothetical protein